MGGSAAYSNRIGDLRRARNLTQEALAARIGDETTIATISRLESGRMTLTYPWILRISRALGVSPHEIIAAPGGGLRMVPLIDEIEAGGWEMAAQQPAAYVPAIENIGGPRLFAIRPRGDDLEVDAGESSHIFIDPDQVALEDGKIFAVMRGDKATFKRYRSDPPRLEPMSNNPEHQPIMVGAEPFTVIGRVVYVGRQF